VSKYVKEQMGPWLWDDKHGVTKVPPTDREQVRNLLHDVAAAGVGMGVPVARD
jgi:hypothetical protein